MNKFLLGKVWSILGLSLILGLAFSLTAAGQEPALQFQRITLEDGLSNGTVFSVVQDEMGFMWFGTTSGLNRYDGQDIVVLQHDPTNPNSLSNDNAGNLFIDEAGIIWIGTWGGGLNRFDPLEQSFTIYQNNPEDPNSLSNDRVQTIFEDSAGRLWVGTAGSGLNYFDRETNRFTVYRHNPDDPESLSNDRIWRIVEDNEGYLWVATSEGLNRFNPLTGTATPYFHQADDPTSLSDSLIRTLHIDRQGVLWVGTENGLNRYHPETDSFTRYRHQADNPRSLSDDIINAIYEDRQGNFWVGTSRGGLNQMNRATESFTPYRHDTRDPNSLSYDDVRSIYEDRSGVLWISTRGGGVNKLSPIGSQFNYYHHQNDAPNSLSSDDVRAIFLAEDGMLWIGTRGGGLNRYNPETETFTIYQSDPNDPTTLSENDVYALHPGPNQTLWLGLSGGGLNQFDPASGQVIASYRADPDNPRLNLASDDINSLYQAPDGLLWLGTEGGGLSRFNPQDESFLTYQHNPDDETSLGSDDIYDILPADGGLWLATFGGGLNFFDPERETFTRYLSDPADPTSLSNNDVLSLHQSDAGALWVGTANGGLNRFDPATETFTRYTTAEGLPSNVIYGITEDGRERLWISTSRGLVRFNPEAAQSATYDTSDGLPNIGYTEQALFTAEDGTLFFGGINGLLAFNPLRLEQNNVPPLVSITAINAPGQTIISPRSPLTQALTLTLPKAQNSIAFEFVALDYTNPAKNQYSYKLGGFDEDWVLADTRSFANYTNLDAGSYTFRVRGATRNASWNEAGTPVTVTILPAVWETWWFRGGILLAMVALIAGIVQLRSQRNRLIRRRLESEVAARTTELSSANDRLKTLNDRFQSELSIARKVQQNLLPPHHPNWNLLDMVCHSQAAEEVGGDFYTYYAFPRNNNAPQTKYGLAVGDVSGKGMPAALLMAISLASFQSAIAHSADPVEMMVSLDEALAPYTYSKQQNCALCYVEVTRNHLQQTVTLQAINAGCIAPIVRRKNGHAEILNASGLPLGSISNSHTSYEMVDMTLKSGELVILTSDGVVEATNAQGDLLGFDRLLEIIEAAPTSSAQTMLDYLQQSVSRFIGQAKAHDDLTIMVIRV